MKTSLILLTALCLSGVAQAAPGNRVVSLGGDITEIVYALGAGEHLVCDDQTSLYPAAAATLPQVGYLRTLAAEGVLSCKPDLILASGDAGPTAAMAELQASGVKIVPVTNAHSPDAVPVKIATVAEALGLKEKGADLIARYRTDLATARAEGSMKTRPRALFLMVQGAGGAMAAGHGSAADAMLTLAGAENVAGFEGYKPLTAESAVALHPDVIIVGAHGAEALGGVEALRKRPEITLTPAARSGHVVAIDEMLLLGFGLRLPEALTTLREALR